MQQSTLQPMLGAIILADQADASGRACALADVDGESALQLALSLCSGMDLQKQIVVSGCDAEAVARELAQSDWEILQNPDWSGDPVSGVRASMRALPLLDAFLLVDCAKLGDAHGAFLDCADGIEQVVRCYQSARLDLMRVVVPLVNSQRSWPWLIDIGFRQPFVERDPAAGLEDVLTANASQVIELELKL